VKNHLFFVLLSFILIACSPKVNSQSDLKLIKSIKLSISEPSGITIFNGNLYIASDENGIIYRTNLEGEILQKIKTSFSDLEGISYNPISKNLLLVDESKRHLITLNFDGTFIEKVKVKGKQEHKNSGLEGVTFDTSKNKIYVLNEKSPKQLLELNLKGEIKNKFELDFSKDVSGICYDENEDKFWVISDESKAIYQISKKGKLRNKYKVSIEKMEGIVIYRSKIYVVSDSLNKLFIFEKPK